LSDGKFIITYGDIYEFTLYGMVYIHIDGVCYHQMVFDVLLGGHLHGRDIGHLFVRDDGRSICHFYLHY
jgi:hypothetical protein